MRYASRRGNSPRRSRSGTSSVQLVKGESNVTSDHASRRARAPRLLAIVFAAWATTCASNVHAAPQGLDRTFGDAGLAQWSSAFIEHFAVLPDGRIVAASATTVAILNSS